MSDTHKIMEEEGHCLVCTVWHLLRYHWRGHSLSENLSMVSLGTASSSSLASCTMGRGGGRLGPSSSRNSSSVAGSLRVPSGAKLGVT